MCFNFNRLHVHICVRNDIDDDIPNPFAADDVIQRLNESDKTKEFMKDQAFLDKLEYLSRDSHNLVDHMADHRVMTALAVLLDVDVTVPESKYCGCCI